MRTFKSQLIRLILLIIVLSGHVLAGPVDFQRSIDESQEEYQLANDKIRLSVCVKEGKLTDELIQAKEEWLSGFPAASVEFRTDADFRIEVIWSGWKAPGRINNADNALVLTKEDFRVVEHQTTKLSDGTHVLALKLRSETFPFEVRVLYRLQSEKFYLRKKITIRDPKNGRHFLSFIWPCWVRLGTDVSVIKKVGFGQPVAFKVGDGGAFMGLEYPTADNTLIRRQTEKAVLRCGQEMGLRIGPEWTASEWVVLGLTPDTLVKRGFWEYLDDIRVARVEPYLLYNSWYDLRAPVMVEDPKRSLTEENVLRTIASFKERMFVKRGLHLDAFVLDDGWDVYKSDWVLNREQFPNGLSPIAEALKPMSTALGIWLGPIGGYSHRDWRVDWMKAHGYEAVNGQMCVAGTKYHQLLKKRLTDLVRNEGVSYYKWDGIRFTCNEPGHGHLPGIYSRRAVMEAVADLCRSVRAENQSVFLNITSGTWLSPWWLKYGNMIWMQGYDYGYADVPSLSRRDRAMTYRDSVLYDDLREYDFWFPIVNLMTHGIIKGHLQLLGGEEESLRKFTDNALLYFARGVAMWELYVSPDYLTEAEWDVLAQAIRWAKERFPILRSTEMIGGDPDERRAYGFAHFSGSKGLLAVRNPFIEPQTITLELSEGLGLTKDADSLVLEKIYPVRRVSSQLYAAGSVLEIPLQGYETAAYEIFPIGEAAKPLIAGRRYELLKKNDNDKETILHVYGGEEEARILNPNLIKTATFQGKDCRPEELVIPGTQLIEHVERVSFASQDVEQETQVDLQFTLKDPILEGTLALLLDATETSDDEAAPGVRIILDGKEVEPKIEQQKGRWGWYLIPVQPGRHSVQYLVVPTGEGKRWEGTAAAWLLFSENTEPVELKVELKQPLLPSRPEPPLPWQAGEAQRAVKLGMIKIKN